MYRFVFVIWWNRISIPHRFECEGTKPFIFIEDFKSVKHNDIIYYDKPDTKRFTINKLKKIMFLRQGIEKLIASNDFKESMLEEEFSKNYYRCIDILKGLEETAGKLEKILSYDVTRLTEVMLVIAWFIFSTFQIKEFVV